MDIFEPKKRSEVMSHIRAKGTVPELFVRKLLFSAGFRYRLYVRSLPGCPDIVLPKWRTVVFVNGCFWHSHEGCRFAARPSQNAEFWRAKLSRNRERDLENITSLVGAGWRVLTVWECACRKRDAGVLKRFMSDFIVSETVDVAEIGRSDVAA